MLFKQVYDYLLERIQRGEWSEDEKLPSVRSLSAELHVHRLTVFKAYQMLKNNNKVYVKDKQGYYIQTGAVMPFHSLQDPIVLASVQGSSLSEIHDVKVDYQFSKALLDPNLLPNHYFAEYAKKVFDLYPKVLGTYSTIQGDQELREALTRYFTEKYRFYITADELLVTSGSQQAIDLVARALVRSRDIVLVEQPTYSPAIDVFTRLGARMIPVEIHPHGYDLDQVEMLMQQFKPRLFYMNPTFHNPTGYTIPAEQRKRLVELAQTYRCLIMEDDPYRDIYFGEKLRFRCSLMTPQVCDLYPKLQQICGSRTRDIHCCLPPCCHEGAASCQVDIGQWNASAEPKNLFALFLLRAYAAASG